VYMCIYEGKKILNPNVSLSVLPSFDQQLLSL
jgi:hypothetical protein